MTLEQIADLEEIKKLKARYFRLMDTKQWDEWAAVFTEDARLQWGSADSDVIEGRDNIVRTVSRALNGAVTCHHGHMPEIEIRNEREAVGVWAMFDHVDHPRFVLNGFGHYHEEYVKDDSGTWRIRSTRLTRLREDRRAK